MVLQADTDSEEKGQYKRCGQIGGLAPRTWSTGDEPWIPKFDTSLLELEDCVDIVVNDDGVKHFVIDIL
jgi:hypothetical protein